MRVEQLPFPYQNVTQMEKSLSQPIGSTWNTASAVRQMVKPNIELNPGEIIEPASLQKQNRFSDIFPVELTGNEKNEKKGGKHKDKKNRMFPKKKKGGRRITAADGTSLSNM